MASQRQIQYKQESTKEDSLGIKDAQQVESQKVEAKPKNQQNPLSYQIQTQPMMPNLPKN
jgi:hypothetical protein